MSVRCAGLVTLGILGLCSGMCRCCSALHCKQLRCNCSQSTALRPLRRCGVVWCPWARHNSRIRELRVGSGTGFRAVTVHGSLGTNPTKLRYLAGLAGPVAWLMRCNSACHVLWLGVWLVCVFGGLLGPRRVLLHRACICCACCNNARPSTRVIVSPDNLG